jgi:hypothetical protein
VKPSACVLVPNDYVADYSSALHDYCTLALNASLPNQAGTMADFKGPCARHDQCYEAHDRSGWPSCDQQLENDLKANCDCTFAASDTAHDACYLTAMIYRTAVTLWNR